MKKIMILILMFISFRVFAEDILDVKVVRVYDGDTFFINLNSILEGKTLKIFESIGVRIRGIDTPELRTKCKIEKAKGYKAKEFLVDQLKKVKQVNLLNVEKDKYFRLLADVELVYANKKVLFSKLLIENHLAVKYFGGKKMETWGCS